MHSWYAVNQWVGGGGPGPEPEPDVGVADILSITTDGVRATWDGTPPALDPNNDPVGVELSRGGFLTDGTWSASAYTERLRLTSRWVLGYEGPGLEDGRLDGNNCAIERYIYETDVPAGPSSGVTNNSTHKSPKPNCRMQGLHGELVGNSYTHEVVPLHQDAREGEQVAAVRLWLGRGTPYERSAVVSASSMRIGSRSGLAMIQMAHTFDLSDVPDGTTLARDFEALPWTGKDDATYADSSVRKSWEEDIYSGGTTYILKNAALKAAPNQGYYLAGAPTTGQYVGPDPDLARASPWGSMLELMRAMVALPSQNAALGGAIIRFHSDNDFSASPWPFTADATLVCGGGAVYYSKDHTLESQTFTQNWRPYVGDGMHGYRWIICDGLNWTHSSGTAFTLSDNGTDLMIFNFHNGVFTKATGGGIITAAARAFYFQNTELQFNGGTVLAGNSNGSLLGLVNINGDVGGSQLAEGLVHSVNLNQPNFSDNNRNTDVNAVSVNVIGWDIQSDGAFARTAPSESYTYNHRALNVVLVPGNPAAGHSSRWSQDGHYANLNHAGGHHITIPGYGISFRAGGAYDDMNIGAAGADTQADQRRTHRNFDFVNSVISRLAYKGSNFVSVNQVNVGATGRGLAEAPFRQGAEHFRHSVGFSGVAEMSKSGFVRQFYGVNWKGPEVIDSEHYDPQFEDNQGFQSETTVGTGFGDYHLKPASPVRGIGYRWVRKWDIEGNPVASGPQNPGAYA